MIRRHRFPSPLWTSRSAPTALAMPASMPTCRPRKKAASSAAPSSWKLMDTKSGSTVHSSTARSRRAGSEMIQAPVLTPKGTRCFRTSTTARATHAAARVSRPSPPSRESARHQRRPPRTPGRLRRSARARPGSRNAGPATGCHSGRPRATPRLLRSLSRSPKLRPSVPPASVEGLGLHAVGAHRMLTDKSPLPAAIPRMLRTKCRRRPREGAVL